MESEDKGEVVLEDIRKEWAKFKSMIQDQNENVQIHCNR